ncbi:CD1871A family CXXC motif-containing protein [Selenomonas ruminantium]|nr:CD1871A family CXXC motif-containing protein [Selenomonas ruminantium]
MNRQLKARSVLAVLAAAALIYGIWRGEMEIIFQKAIRVCMECIGLG